MRLQGAFGDGPSPEPFEQQRRTTSTACGATPLRRLRAWIAEGRFFR